MQKDFDGWNNEKKLIHKQNIAPFYHSREIWWCSLGVNIGFERDGTGKNFDRPVIVVKGFNKNVFLGVALTGKEKNGKYYFYLGEIEGYKSSAVLSQIRLIDTKRLIRKICTLEESLFEKLKSKLQSVLFG